jgi:tripartite-type tricarboxylate transporter receptor subunit TctC
MQNTYTRRRFLADTAALSAIAALGQPALALAQAQLKLKSPIRLIVPYPPGAATDALGRLMGQALEPAVGATFIVDNKGGAGTQIGTRDIANALPDGQTLGFIDTAFVINPGLFGAKLPYDTERDFTPLSLMATAPLMLIVHSSVPANTLQEFIALVKSQPGKYSFGSSGIGSAPHLAGEQFRMAAGLEVSHVPYRGGSTVMTDLIAGHVQFGFTTVPTMVDNIRAGRVRALAVTTPTRAPQLPDVPTMAQAGLPSVNATPLFGLIGPGRLPPAIVDALSTAASAAVRADPLNKRLLELGFVPVGSTAPEFKARIAQEIQTWASVIKAGNIKPDA